ncbi:MAG: PQQ-dependent sugar dehydrogenase [Pseudomonadota bacterium]
MQYTQLVLPALATLTLAACGTSDSSQTGEAAVANALVANTAPTDVVGTKTDLPGDYPFDAYAVATFDEPWAMTFLPDGRLLVTEKAGQLRVLSIKTGNAVAVSGVPDVHYGGQGGLGDVVLHPEYARNRTIYLSYAAQDDDGNFGARVARATLAFSTMEVRLENVETIWSQVPFVPGKGHYGHRIAFDDEGYLFISSGERQKFDPSQDMQANLGKVVRLNDDGSVPADNPFADQGGVTAQIWSLGHRNPLGLAFDANGQLWNSEMGPAHGDELNKVEPGNNYGYPLVSNGDHYNGDEIPDHDTRPDLDAPATYWVPAISPAGLMFYDGDVFADWRGNAFLGGLSSQALVRVAFDGDNASEAARYPMGARIREMEQGPDGAIWLLEDGSDGRLLKLLPAAR